MIRSRAIGVLVLLLFCTLASSSEPQAIPALGRLVVHVRQTGNIPVQHAFVYIHNDIGERLANLSGQIGDLKPSVDEVEGRAEVRLSAGADYDVFAVSAGYFPACQMVHIEAGKTTEITIDIKLKDDFYPDVYTPRR